MARQAGQKPGKGGPWISERARQEAAQKNAARQAAYRERHLHDPDSVDSERINLIVPLKVKRQLERLASHYGVTQGEMLGRALAKAESKVLDGLTGAQQNDYYDRKTRATDR